MTESTRIVPYERACAWAGVACRVARLLPAHLLAGFRGGRRYPRACRHRRLYVARFPMEADQLAA